MHIKQALELIGKILSMYLTMGIFTRKSGKIIIELDIRNGGVGNIHVNTKQSFQPHDLTD